MFGKNIDKGKVQVKVGMKHFLVHAFEKFYIVIWSCVKLEDVLKVLPMLILDTFMDQVVFILDANNVQRLLFKFLMGLI
jgi:hypothetical protein